MYRTIPIDLIQPEVDIVVATDVRDLEFALELADVVLDLVLAVNMIPVWIVRIHDHGQQFHPQPLIIVPDEAIDQPIRCLRPQDTEVLVDKAVFQLRW